jgi:hypothetical protein
MDWVIGVKVGRESLRASGRGSELKTADRAAGWMRSQEHEEVEGGWTG